MKFYKYIPFFLLISPVTFLFSQNEKQISFRNLTINHGLSQNSVISIAQDTTGYMWFATQDGLNKYDGKSFDYYYEQFEDVTRDTYSYLGKVYCDKEGNIWIIAHSGKLKKFLPEYNTFQWIESIKDANAVFQDSQKNIYAATRNDGLFKIDFATKDTVQLFKEIDKSTVVFDFLEINQNLYLATDRGIAEVRETTSYSFQEIPAARIFSCLTKSNDNRLAFAGTFGTGLFQYNNTTFKWEPFQKLGNDTLPPNLNIEDIYYDAKNRLWIATYGSGLYLADFNTHTIRHFEYKKHDPNAISYQDLLTIFEDQAGTIWVGTDGGGVNYYDEHLYKFNILTNSQLPEYVDVDIIRAISVTEDGTMWLGTSGKGLTKVRFSQNEYHTYTTQNSAIASNRIISLLHSQDTLWIGTQSRGVSVLTKKGFKNFNIFVNPLHQESGVWAIFKDSSNRLWLGVKYLGLVQFDYSKGIINQYNTDQFQGQVDNIRCITEDENGRLWIGTDEDGLYRFTPGDNFLEKIAGIPYKIKSLYYQKGTHTLWVGTNGNGLIKYGVKTMQTTVYGREHNLPNNVIYGILEDNQNNLWLSSNRGISRFDSKAENFTNYSNHDGLQADEFNTGAYFKDLNGNLFFGGIYGLNWFDPQQLTFNTVKPKTVISGFEIFSKYTPMVNGQKFQANQNTMTFTFSGLHFSLPERNQYRYMLENYDSDWINAGNTNKAHYTNLPPGNYTFKALSSNYDGVWGDVPASFSFVILKPWYVSTYAFIIYGLLLIALGILFYKYLKWRWKLKMQLQIEHHERERLENLNRLRNKLFNNISHEFRTPLSLISGPVENQLKRKDLNEDDKLELHLIKRNANRLLRLINQLLEMARLESGNVTLKVASGNWLQLIDQIVKSFTHKMEEKNITFNSKYHQLDKVWFDKDLVEKIVTNLLSNAVKFTPENGEIQFSCVKEKNKIKIHITNNTSELSKINIDKIFDRYFMGNHPDSGTGIGLSLVKELATLSHGKAEATIPEPGKIAFKITLPAEKDSFAPAEISHVNSEIKTAPIVDDLSMKNTKKAETILIVEDDTDMRLFIHAILENHYNILKAENGQKGIDIALAKVPDLIISDVMMPVKSGIELCNTLKNDERASHIPIVMLTAKSGSQNEISGLQSGADAYITKPFNADVLRLTISNLLETRSNFKKHFSKNLHFTPEITLVPAEKEFLERLQNTTKTHLTNPELTSEKLAELMRMSRTQLHRKLQGVFGTSTSEFIRSQRIKMAVELIKKNEVPISEIAYLVGFNSPSYFNKCFREIYGCTPGEYISNVL